MMKPLIGVWIGKDIEIIRTKRFEMVFERTASRDPLYRSELYSICFEEGRMSKSLIGLCEYYADSDTVNYSIRLSINDNIYAFDNQTTRPLDAVPQIHLIQQSSNSTTASFQAFKEVYDNRRLTLYRDGVVSHVLEKDEDLDVVDVRTDPLILAHSTVGDSLIAWRTGTAVGQSYASPDKINPYVEITTNRHAYVFSINHDLVYCRAARYETCDIGMVFGQNFRISQIEKYGKQAYMLVDNRLASEQLTIKPEYFDFQACTVTPEEEGGKIAGIYWSVKEKSDHFIILHGCRGDQYYFPRIRQDLIEFYR